MKNILIKVTTCVVGVTANMFSPASAQVTVYEVPMSSPSSEFKKLLSGNGSTVIGVLANGSAGRWQADSGITELGNFIPYGVDTTGGVVCGVAGNTAVRWTAATGVEYLALPDEYQSSVATATSAFDRFSGQVGLAAGVYKAVEWTLSSGWRPIELPIEAIWSAAVDVSKIGVIAGNWQGPGGFVRAFWSYGGNPRMLEGLGQSQSLVWDVSAMGNAFVGLVPIPNDPYPFTIGIPHLACVWASSGGPRTLPLLPSTQRSDARATSEWGSVIVGSCYGVGVGPRATVWVDDSRAFDLTQYVECYSGAATPPVVFTHSIGVSDDGRTILARDYSRLFLITGFEPPAGPDTDLNQDRITNGADLGLLLLEWGTCAAPCSSDLNRDNAVNGDDLGLLLANWGNCI